MRTQTETEFLWTSIPAQRRYIRVTLCSFRRERRTLGKPRLSFPYSSASRGKAQSVVAAHINRTVQRPDHVHRRAFRSRLGPPPVTSHCTWCHRSFHPVVANRNGSFIERTFGIAA